MLTNILKKTRKYALPGYFIFGIGLPVIYTAYNEKYNNNYHQTLINFNENKKPAFFPFYYRRKKIEDEISSIIKIGVSLFSFIIISISDNFRENTMDFFSPWDA